MTRWWSSKDKRITDGSNGDRDPVKHTHSFAPHSDCKLFIFKIICANTHMYISIEFT